MEQLGSPHVHIIQDLGTQNARLIEQLHNRHVDAGQYYGEWLTAERWQEWCTLHPQHKLGGIALDEDVSGELVVVDLGPGTADPSIDAISTFRERIAQVICVDTSNEIALMAAENYQKQLGIPASVVVADFIRDTEKIASTIAIDARSKVILCLGNTVANYDQQHCFARFRQFLQDTRDRMILGLGLHEGSNADAEIKKLGELLASPENLQFALEFLRQYGVNIDEGSVDFETSDDPSQQGVKLVRVRYRFPQGKLVTVDPTLDPGGVRFKEGDKLQFVESRRYPKQSMADFFGRHRLDLLATQDFGSHGLFLLKKADSSTHIPTISQSHGSTSSP